MRFSCESCGAHYMISDEKVGPNGVKVRCKKCSHVIVVRRPPPEPEATASPPPAPAGDGAPRSDGLDEELGQAFDKVMSSAPAAPSEEPAAPPAEAEAPAAPAAAAAPLAGEWYLAIDDQQVGPMPPEGVRTRWEAGEIGPDTLVWCAGQADWGPLSSVQALARYLAPVPRGERPLRAPEPAPAASPAPAPEPARAEPQGWKPAAASALAALASEELRPAAAPAAAPAPRPGGPSSLLDSMNLPDAGGVDPTGVLPLPIKALETTEERNLKRQSSVARTTAEVRLKRSTNRTIALAAVALGLIVCGAAGGLWWYFERRLQGQLRGREVPVAALPAPPAPAPPPAASAAPSPSAVAVQPPPAAPPAPPPQVVEAPPPAPPSPPVPAAAAPPPEPAPSRSALAKQPPKPKKKGKGELATRKSAERLAAAETAAAPPAPSSASRKTGDPLLDASDVDADFERELSGGAKPKRSVYVPPAAGSDLPDRLTEAQINEGVASRIDALKQCLEQQTAAQPDTHGTLKMRWLIQGDGSVNGVKALSPEFGGQPIASCIASVVKTIRFPRSRTTGQEVVFPFRF